MFCFDFDFRRNSKLCIETVFKARVRRGGWGKCVCEARSDGAERSEREGEGFQRERETAEAQSTLWWSRWQSWGREPVSGQPACKYHRLERSHR